MVLPPTLGLGANVPWASLRWYLFEAESKLCHIRGGVRAGFAFDLWVVPISSPCLGGVCPPGRVGVVPPRGRPGVPPEVAVLL